MYFTEEKLRQLIAETEELISRYKEKYYDLKRLDKLDELMSEAPYGERPRGCPQMYEPYAERLKISPLIFIGGDYASLYGVLYNSA